MWSASLLLVSMPLALQGQFEPPRAKIQYAPDRTFDLRHVSIVLDVDYANRAISGHTVNALSPLRSGLKRIRLHAGPRLEVKLVQVDGKPAKFVRDGADLWIDVPSSIFGKEMSVRTEFRSVRQSGAGFGGGEGGWHWIEANAKDPYRIGFWTQGETLYNRNWSPTWDYPNDFATSETITTAPADWTVVGNGVLASEKTANGRKTTHWRMTKPHATYLISLVGGPFETKRDKWQDIDLWYVVPKGYGKYIDDSFGDTKDMLDFFSARFGVKYPWAKYAQNAMHDFGGGMENVSATTLGVGNVTDRRSGFYTMSGLNAHELGHQWFGDLVSCKDWGHIWLNESWATFSQQLYFEHARGRAEYDRQIEGAMQGYFGEARRYKRPLATNLYEHPDNVFDSHAYPKGAAVLHSMRRLLGDEAFFRGTKRYLQSYGYGPVETNDFCRALTESSGVNMAPFFDQWVYRPGHPVVEYTWRYDSGSKSVVVDISQTQPTDKGTPIYRIDTEVLLLKDGKSVRSAVRLDSPKNRVTISAPEEPDAVVLDPDHDFLREMRHDFAALELRPIAEFAPNAVDRAKALDRLLSGAQSTEANVSFAIKLLKADQGRFPVFESSARLVGAKFPVLRVFFTGELKHPFEYRRRDAVKGLAAIGLQAADKTVLGAMLTDQEMYSVVFAIIEALDPQEDRALLLKASKIASRDDRVRLAAEKRLKG